MKKLRIALISMLLIAVAMLASCTKNGEKATTPDFDKPIYEWGKFKNETITMCGAKNDLERPYIVRAIKNYENVTGSTIKITEIDKNQTSSKAQTTEEDGNEKFDILLSYGGTNLEDLDSNINFYDFTDAPWVDDLTDTALNQSIYKAKVVGLPYGEASISGTLYNKGIFKKYNLKIPKTQEEFMAVCETLLKNGITPMYLPYSEITMLLYQLPMDSIVQDKKILAGLNSGELSYSEIPQMHKIIEWYKTMSDKGYFGEDYLGNDWGGMDSAMQNGKYAMMLCWDTWIYTSFTGDTNSLGLMPAFVGTPEEGCFEGANVLLMIANKNSEKIDVILDFINFLADPYNYNISYEGLYTAPLFKNQNGSITTPQYIESERLIDKLYYDSTAWTRIKGFDQSDASYIQSYMQNECSANECLENMNTARLKRTNTKH